MFARHVNCTNHMFQSEAQGEATYTHASSRALDVDAKGSICVICRQTMAAWTKPYILDVITKGLDIVGTEVAG